MLLCTYGGLCAVAVGGEELAHHGLHHLAAVLGHGDVLLLIHSLQFGMETAHHHILETVSL